MTLSQTVTSTRMSNGRNTATYNNPVIRGFAPDPSVVYVDGYFFLVTSSFHIFPGIPIYVSQDLKSWTHIGNAINRVDQIDLSRATTHAFPLDTGFTMIASAGLWAPTTRYHNGTFYIISTNCTRGGEAFDTQNFYISTTDIWSNKWSDPIMVEIFGIDPSLFFDDDGKVYYQGCWELTRSSQPSCTIKQFEIDIKTGKPLSDIREIWGGFAKQDTEGPHIYKKDGFYYLFVAEGGTSEHHMLSFGRSENIWGPYESCEHNPVLTSDKKDEYIQNTGHGELFQDGEGSWWAVVLGVRGDVNDRCPIGRESFLTPVDWPTGSWPTIHQPQMTFKHAPVLRQVSRSLPKSLKLESHVDDVYIRNAQSDHYSFPTEKDTVLRSSSCNLSVETGSPTFVGKRQREMECSAYAALHVDSQDKGKTLEAGLAVYKDSHRHAGIYYEHKTSSVYVCVVDRSRTDAAVITTAPQEIDATKIHFRIRGTALAYEFSYRESADTMWTSLTTVDAMSITARDFTGTIVGIGASGSGGGVGRRLHFEDFELIPEVRPIVS